jgi:rod shape determining protein RodA
MWVAVGCGCMLGALLIDYSHLEKIAWPIYIITVIALIYVLVNGAVIYGARRWISFGSFSFQPSEITKLSVIIIMAKYFSKSDNPYGYTFKTILVPSLLAIIPFLLILKEPDLGTALLIIMIFAATLLFVGLRLRTAGQIFLGILIAIPIAWFFFLKEYQKDRIRVFLDPAKDRLGDAWHITQSIIAVGSGKLLGKGYLAGTQSKLEFVPKQHTDFIFSVFAEEWGFIGSLLALLVFFLLIVAGYSIAARAKDKFGSIVAFGITTMLFAQIFVNIGMELDILPVVGVTLPFFSYGGSSLVISMIGIGLLLNINMRRHMF